MTWNKHLFDTAQQVSVEKKECHESGKKFLPIGRLIQFQMDFKNRNIKNFYFCQIFQELNIQFVFKIKSFLFLYL